MMIERADTAPEQAVESALADSWLTPTVSKQSLPDAEPGDGGEAWPTQVDPASRSHRKEDFVPGRHFGGRRHDRFLIEEEIGRGAQAAVFKVSDSRLSRTIALKLCTAPDGQKRAMFVERFEREMQLTSRVAHPHVLEIYDCGELDDETPYVFLEWMPYGSLADMVRKTRAEQVHIPLEWVLYYARAVAAALRATHAAEIVHRDIKPDNILIGKGGVAKVTDFGISRDISPETVSMTEVGQTLGTVGFMAPEQVGGLPGPQSDIFSLGVTLYTLLTGKLPKQKRLNGVPTGIIEAVAWKQVPAPLVQVLQHMTAGSLSKRYANCDAVLEALAAVELGEDKRPSIPRDELPPLPSRAFISGITSAIKTPAVEEGENEGGAWPFSNPGGVDTGGLLGDETLSPVVETRLQEPAGSASLPAVSEPRRRKPRATEPLVMPPPGPNPSAESVDDGEGWRDFKDRRRARRWLAFLAFLLVVAAVFALRFLPEDSAALIDEKGEDSAAPAQQP